MGSQQREVIGNQRTSNNFKLLNKQNEEIVGMEEASATTS